MNYLIFTRFIATSDSSDNSVHWLTLSFALQRMVGQGGKAKCERNRVVYFSGLSSFKITIHIYTSLQWFGNIPFRIVNSW